MDKIKELSTLEEVQVFSVPYRIKILDYMYSFKAPATVKNIADKMGETPAKIHYHIKKMEQAGIVKLIYTKHVNGIEAKFYEPTAELFQINHKEGMDKSKILSHTQKTIAALYDESKKNFLEQMDISNTKNNGFVTGGDLYLTQEEFTNMMEEIENIRRKYSDTTDKEGKNKYKTFISIIATK